MEYDLISVIVPVYNVERYLIQCIDSIIKQTYSNLQIILVNDGSTDNSSKICDMYAKKDNRITVIHKSNGGLSDARNVGLDEAKGKYIVFIDSDDYIKEQYIELLYNAIKENNTLIAQCGIKKVNNNRKELQTLGYEKNTIITAEEAIIDMSGEHWVENIVVWNKMYHIELLKNTRFRVGKLHEDEFYTYKVLYDAERISIIQDSLYCYRQNDESITGKKYNLKRLDVLEAFEERLQFFKKMNELKLYHSTLVLFLQLIKQSYCSVKKHYSSKRKILKGLKEKYREIYINILTIRDVSIKIKVKALFFYIMPNLYYHIKSKGEE